MAIGASQQTSLVQCNVGDKSPVLLCALLPGKSESLQLNLEFDEDEEVLFSVIGPRGVHLTGFYTGVDRTFNDDVSYPFILCKILFCFIYMNLIDIFLVMLL